MRMRTPFLGILVTISTAFASLASAESFDLTTAERIPQPMIDLLAGLDGRPVRLVGESLKSLSGLDEGRDGGLTCSQITPANSKFYVFRDGETLRFSIAQSDESSLADLTTGPIGGFQREGFTGFSYSSGTKTVEIDGGTIAFHSTHLYYGVNTAISGKIAQSLNYRFGPAIESGSSGLKVRVESTANGGGVSYARTCEYVVD